MTNIIKRLNLTKKNDRVYYSKDKLSKSVSYSDAIELKDFAIKEKLKLFRVCFHKSDKEQINEMLMIHSEPQEIGPLKQINKPSISFIVLEGEAEINLMNDDGEVEKKIYLSSFDNKKSKYCRLDSSCWRKIVSTSKFFIFFEISGGPFKDSDTVWLKK